MKSAVALGTPPLAINQRHIIIENMGSATLDPKGIVVACSSCGQKNRVAYGNLDQTVRCGRCKTEFSGSLNEPVDIRDPSVFHALVNLSPLPVLIDFWASWCGPCKMMAPEFRLAASLLTGNFILAKLDTDEVSQVAQHFGISSIPTLAIFYEGREVARSAGARSAEQIAQWAQRAVEGVRV